MSDTVANIQATVRWLARDSTFSLIDTQGLRILNYVYRRLSAIIPWPEFNREDTSASTTAGQEAVTWPAVKFIDVTQVEIKDPSDNLNYQVVAPARTEVEFSSLRNEEASFPQLYKRTNDGTQDIVQFAPAPKVGSLTVRIIGQTEPTALATSASTTEFIGLIPDDVLAYMIASDIMDKRNQPERAQQLLSVAAELLSSIAGREITPAELKTGPSNVAT
jgi:hypothetical protein